MNELCLADFCRDRSWLCNVSYYNRLSGYSVELYGQLFLKYNLSIYYKCEAESGQIDVDCLNPGLMMSFRHTFA